MRYKIQSLVLAVMLAFTVSGSVGCKTTLDAAGPYAGDTVAFNAEDIIGDADEVFTKVFELELSHFDRVSKVDLTRANEVREAVNRIRIAAWTAKAEAVAANELYKSLPSRENTLAKDRAIAVLRGVIARASYWLIKLEVK